MNDLLVRRLLLGAGVINLGAAIWLAFRGEALWALILLVPAIWGFRAAAGRKVSR